MLGFLTLPALLKPTPLSYPFFFFFQFSRLNYSRVKLCCLQYRGVHIKEKCGWKGHGFITNLVFHWIIHLSVENQQLSTAYTHTWCFRSFWGRVPFLNCIFQKTWYLGLIKILVHVLCLRILLWGCRASPKLLNRSKEISTHMKVTYHSNSR